MKKNKFLFSVLALTLAVLMLVLTACQTGKTPKETTDQTDVATGESTEAATEDLKATTVRVMALNGTTGFGMAKLMSDAKDGKTALTYDFSVETDASNITAALISGSVDIAALPTNAASVVYNKTKGKVQALALNTLGVLYLVTGEGETVTSFADLEGKTVYAPAQNPSFIFQYLCEQNHVNVTVDNTYAQPADLRTAVASGEVKLAVLPEPMVTIACSANANLTVALDLTAEWDKVAPKDSLTQGCVVVRTEFAAAHPEIVTAFLAEYGASIAYLTSNTAEAAELIVANGIFTNAGVATKAIPKCNVCFLTGAEMKTSLSAFLSVMNGVNAASIGGALPADDFYYGAN